MPRYRFISGCPACGNKTISRWNHSNCSNGSSCGEEIDEEGYIYCLGCNKKLGFILDIKFSCGNHDSHQPVKDATNVLSALATMTDIPAEFAKNITRKIDDRLR